MTQTEPSVTSTTLSGVTSHLLGRLKTLLVVAVIGGLIALNILTLVSDRAHSIAYGAVAAVAGWAAVAAVMRAISSRPILENSPTNKRKDHVRNATATLEREKRDLHAAKTNVDSKNAALEKSHKGLEAEKAALSKSHKGLEAEKAALSKSNSELATKMKAKTEAAKKLSTKVAARAAKSAARNVAGMAGQAIPYIGVGLMVGITALDVKDACDNLKDLNEMHAEFDLQKEDESKVCGMRIPSGEEIIAGVKKNWQAAYRAAAESVNRTGDIVLPSQPPVVYWSQVRDFVGPVFGAGSPPSRK